MIDKLKNKFPVFVSKLTDEVDLEGILAGATESEIKDEEEKYLKIPLPVSYKEFIRTTRGFCLFGGAVQLGEQHPFFHEFSSLEDMNEQQKEAIESRGEVWPPPSDGMLCFGEYFRDADGDQVLFDVSKGLVNDEYPVYYYSHETTPPSVTKVADSFAEWIEYKCIDQMV